MSKNQIKAQIRETCLKLRNALSVEEQYRASIQICTHIQTLQEYQQARYIASYMATRSEVDLSSLRQSIHADEKCFFLPVVHHQTLLFLTVDEDTPIVTNQYAISEPHVPPTQALSPNQLDLILIPVVAFDIYGTRIGMGKGYYDRALENITNPLRLGVAYECQKQAFIQPDQWDIPLDGIITEKALYKVNF